MVIDYLTICIKWLFVIFFTVLFILLMIKCLWLIILRIFGRPDTQKEGTQGFSLVNNFGPMHLLQGENTHVRTNRTYGHDQEIQLKINKLSNRTQQKGESIMEYGHNIIALAHTAGIYADDPV